MIKLKQLLLEAKSPSIFVPRRIEDRIERLVSLYIKNGSKGDLDLSDMNLTVLPDILKDISVHGDFFCGTNNLTKLINAPKTVGGNFYCGHNKLTSLDGAPEYVGGSFYCSFNNLTSLTGAPKFVGGVFSCGFNEIKFTEEQVRAVCNVKGDIYGAL
jgi:hypothetical protein